MTFVEITSLLGALGGVSASVLGFLVYRHQKEANMRPDPVFEINKFSTPQNADGLIFLDLIARSDEIATFSLIRIKCNRAILVAPIDVWKGRDKFGGPAFIWNGLENVTLQKSTEIKGALNSSHYQIPFSNEATRASISLIWSWNDESRLRKTKKKLIIPAKMKS